MRCDEQLGGGDTHLVEGLAHGGEAGVEVLGDDDVVEADDGDVAGAGEAGVFNGADGADGSGVVEAEDGGEVAGAGEEITNGRIAELGGPEFFSRKMQSSGRMVMPISWAMLTMACQRASESREKRWPFMKAMRRWPRS